MQRTPARRKNKKPKMKPKFGYLTGDTIVGKKTDEAVENERYAVCLMDLGTSFCDASPDCEKTAEMARLACQDFAGLQKVKQLYTDRARELHKAAKELKWLYPGSKAY